MVTEISTQRKSICLTWCLKTYFWLLFPFNFGGLRTLSGNTLFKSSSEHYITAEVVSAGCWWVCFCTAAFFQWCQVRWWSAHSYVNSDIQSFTPHLPTQRNLQIQRHNRLNCIMTDENFLHALIAIDLSASHWKDSSKSVQIRTMLLVTVARMTCLKPGIHLSYFGMAKIWSNLNADCDQ